MNDHKSGPIPKLSPVLDAATLDAIAEAVEARRSQSIGRSGDYIRWSIGLVIAAAISYFTTIGTMDTELTKVKTTEDAHFQELLRVVTEMKADIRELRR